ncbi:MAG: endo alpha-1,4 polygalactosaminidase [Anaerolineae bacterium]|nr:endo alpha-1,4 polygalactosaminidase [Anaerolineae bacterium]
MKKMVIFLFLIFMLLACSPSSPEALSPLPSTPPAATKAPTPTSPAPATTATQAQLTATPTAKATATPTPEPTPTFTPTPAELSLKTVASWFYTLEPELAPATVSRLADSNDDLIVLDFIPSDINHPDYPVSEVVSQLHRAGKLVVAYLNIGQAESSRTYWQADWTPGAPWWLIETESANRYGRFPVGYWNDEYRDIWLAEDGYLQAILDAGFDGVYLDGLEAYRDEAIVAFAQEDEADPVQEMIWLVGDIAGFGRDRQPEFMVIGHNAAELINLDETGALLAALDAIAQEEIWFGRAGATSDSEAYLEPLTQAHTKGKVILTLDYTAGDDADRVYETSRALGFVPLVVDKLFGRYVTYDEWQLKMQEEAMAEATAEAMVEPTPLPPRLAAVQSFLYQLQNINLDAVGQTGYDLVVMDYATEKNDETFPFTSTEIEALRHSPGGEKIVVSYMSIGEAETYRPYWNPQWDADNDGQPDEEAPAWLDIENPDWVGNYKVRYWEPEWQAIIFDYTDRLLDAGFDGAYLDIIDAYAYYEEQGRETAAQEMADFVAAIAAHARRRNPDFLIFPQNAPELAAKAPAYLNSVSGIGQEDVYYGYNAEDEMTPPAITAQLERNLDRFKSAGKLVLTIDYASTPANIDEAYRRSKTKGYVPFVTGRSLDRLTINPGHEPD